MRLIFEEGFDERDQTESVMRGYRSHVNDGSRHRLTFYDVTRLSQTLDDECASGRMFFAEPGLVVIPEVTLTNTEAAARTLADEGFFASCSPRSQPTEGYVVLRLP